MARSRSDFRGWSWWALVAASVLVPSCGVALAVFFVIEGRESADQWASILSFFVTVLVAATALIGWLRQRAETAGDLGTLDVAEPEADVVAARVERLAAKVEQVWKAEELRQRLLDPEPLPVSWRTVGPPISDHWRVIGGNNTPIDLDGNLDDLYLTVRTKLPKARLVALGEPGAGKTSLVMRFVLACLAAREQTDAPAGPVPVMLKLSTWTPSVQTLRAWIYARLREDYDFDEPLPLDHLLLVLDGLDEMAEPDRETALTAINAAFSADFPLILTSRTSEYLATIDSRRADVLTAAAAIEIKPLDAAAVRDYLTITTKPSRLPEWASVFAELTADPDGELAGGLSTPLAISLARVAYAERAANPDHLLTFTNRRDLEAHLLAELVPSLYSDVSEHARASWRADDVRPWFSFLARHFRARGISWPDLSDVVPPLVYGLIIGLLAGLFTGTAFSLAAGPSTGVMVGATMIVAIWTYTVVIDPELSSLEQIGRRPLTIWAATSGLFSVILWYLTAQGDLAPDHAVGITLVASLWFLVMLCRSLIALQIAILDFGIVIALTGSPAASPQALAVTALIAIIVASILAAALPHFFIAHVLLFAMGRVPWRVGAFLEDGYRRGVLRKVGGLYYFRHDLLREQLAERPTA
ncbi:NACHT domain-containing protein [Nonomuraea sp. 10N515B]|uniref:NACHT domain-containing protein n=1 Tax=Nonomuraea sp. 10N515B TaxID=3457422 RepID=UPI003FCDDEAD